MFDKILIANRGEIAVRVIRTARRLGIRTVAVYSEADAAAMHVELADEAVCIGSPSASESYLRGETIIDVARRTGAQAIHPGYGFLSENAKFAAACTAANIIFIGPPTEAIRVMGSKSESKRIMAEASVPLVPGYHAEAQDLNRLSAEAQRIGYPVLVKASAGGGGKGMRIVQVEGDLPEAVASAKREAQAAFGDDTLLLERYLTQPRHVEIQIFADTQGECIYLFDRDCSLQRRHQKVIEEAPAPNLSDDTRKRMGEAAVNAARAVNYVGAGTVEFMYDQGEFYFIEMNTRLQVEHPITEMITGLDLVEWQLRIAAGEPLPLRQEQLVCRGHAFEARLYAEDPQRNFLPAVGKLVHLQPPLASPHVRIDTGVRKEDEISIHYDPLIAKLIVWDADRPAALRRLRRALEDYEIAGVTTNLELLAAIARHPAFERAEIDTGFIERHRKELLPTNEQTPKEILAFAALGVLLGRAVEQAKSHREHNDPHSPWNAVTGWRLNHEGHQDLAFAIGTLRHQVILHFRNGGYEVEIDGATRMQATHATLKEGRLDAVLDGTRLHARIIAKDSEITLLRDGRTWHCKLDDPMTSAEVQEAGSGRLTAPMPGKVIAVLVKQKQRVARGEPLIVLEAMKMEHTITAPQAGIVAEIRFAVGDKVSDGDELLQLEES